MRLWDTPKPWLRMLVNDARLLGGEELQSLMAASWAMCEAVLMSVASRNMVIKVIRILYLKVIRVIYLTTQN